MAASGREWSEGGQPAKEGTGGNGGVAFLKETAGTTAVGGPLAVVGPVPAAQGAVCWSGAVAGVTEAREELAEVSVSLVSVACEWCIFQCG